MLESPVLEENLLAVLCRMNRPEETVRDLLRRIAALPENARSDVLTKLLVLSRLRRLETFIVEESREMALVFNVMENDVLRPLFQKVQLESEQRGRQEGRREGLQEGLQEGRAEMLLHLLQRRFGAVPEEWRLRVAGAAP